VSNRRGNRLPSPSAAHVVAEVFELSTADDKTELPPAPAVELSPVGKSAETVELRAEDDKAGSSNDGKD
jgi:hypothetical protein